MHQVSHPVAPATRASSALRPYLALILALLVLGAAAGSLYSSSRPAVYSSTSSVLIDPLAGNPYAPSERNDQLASLETEAQLVRSDAVLGRVAPEVAGDLTLRELADRLTVVVPTNTQIVAISYSAADPELARATAQAVATAYLDNRQQRSEDLSTSQIARVQTQTESVIASLRAATSAAQTGNAAKRAFQRELADALNSELVSLRAQRTTFENATTRPGQIIVPASLPGQGSIVRQLAYPAAGAVAGLLLGIVAGLLLERRRGLVRSPSDAEAVGLPVLTTFPKKTDGLRLRDGVPRPFEEAIRRVLTAVLDATSGGGTVTVGCAARSGTEPGVAAELALALARSGRRVVLVHTDPRGDDDSFDAARAGFSDVLTGTGGDMSTLLVPGPVERVRVLPAGPQTEESRGRFDSDRIRSVLTPLAQTCDVLVFRAGTLADTRGEALLRVSDLTVVVVTPGVSDKTELTQVAQRSRELGRHVVAVVVPKGASYRPRGVPAAGEVSSPSRGNGEESRSADQEPAAYSA
jgi:capsular polysaccharide biosynthesis protein